MSNQPDKRFLIVVLVFGVVAAAVGSHWLASGSIVIGEGRRARTWGVAPSPQETRQAAGIIKKGDVLYYPLCVTWALLGLSMIALTVLAFLTSLEFFLRLSAYSCLTFLLLVAATVATALWYGP